MIKLIRVQSYLGDVYLNPLLVAAIDFQKEDAYVRAGQTDYRMSHENAFAFIADLKGNSKPQTALDELVLTTITKLERDETSNNQRPMWRCRTNTDEGDKVNVFLNKDEPEKDSYHFFEQAGWGKFLMNMSVGESLRCAIHIAMRKNGKWWEVVMVQAKPQNIPDWAQENYTFDEIVTEEDEIEGGAE